MCSLQSLQQYRQREALFLCSQENYTASCGNSQWIILFCSPSPYMRLSPSAAVHQSSSRCFSKQRLNQDQEFQKNMTTWNPQADTSQQGCGCQPALTVKEVLSCTPRTTICFLAKEKKIKCFPILIFYTKFLRTIDFFCRFMQFWSHVVSNKVIFLSIADAFVPSVFQGLLHLAVQVTFQVWSEYA